MTRSAPRPTGPLRVLVAVLLGCLVLLGVAAPARADATDHLQVAVLSEIDTLNPWLATTPAAEMILRQQYERVVGRGISNELVPGLASQWSTSADGRVWTYTFPAGRVWSDGEPLTAQDAEWTLRALAEDPVLRKAHEGLLSGIGGIEAPDATTLVITMVEPQAANPAADLVVLPEHVLSGADLGDPSTLTSVGSGPFVPVDDDVAAAAGSGSPVELIANQHFWRGPAALPGLDFVPQTDSAAAVEALVAGEVDFVSPLSAEQFDSLAGRTDIGTHVGTGRSYTSLVINPGVADSEDVPFGDGSEALRDPLVRQAVQWSIAQDALIRDALQGYGEAGLTLIPPVYPDFTGLSEGSEPFAFDLARAGELLDQAGYLRGDDGLRLGLDGQPLSFRLLIDSEDPTQTMIAEQVTSGLDALGIGVETEALATADLAERVNAGEYDLHIGNQSVGADPDHEMLINTCDARRSSDGEGISEANYCNSEFDQLYAEQHTTVDPAARADLVRQAFTIAYFDGVIRPLYYPQQLSAYRSDRFTGFQPQPAEGGMIAYQNSYWGFYSVAPVQPDSGPGEVVPAPSIQRLRIAVLLLAVVAAVAVVGAAVIVVRRRRRKPSRTLE
ncbi:ABC transporter substrate-binding protein [Naumannella halotolerans]|uniref:ABC transporter substrate-binding protein n=1 Tax=Naumannella halotolerans TaxID=993414 RepID=UPI00370DC824